MKKIDNASLAITHQSKHKDASLDDVDIPSKEVFTIQGKNGYIDLTVEQVEDCVKKMTTWLPKKFYMTLGVDQPHYPGYFIAIAKNEDEARLSTSDWLNGRWCGTYRTFEEVHPKDRIFRGTITADGIVFADNGEV